MKRVVTHEKDGLLVTEEESYPLSEPAARFLGFVIGLLLAVLIILFVVLIVLAIVGA